MKRKLTVLITFSIFLMGSVSVFAKNSIVPKQYKIELIQFENSSSNTKVEFKNAARNTYKLKREINKFLGENFESYMITSEGVLAYQRLIKSAKVSDIIS